ncbi:dihydrodipicolinate synthase family protein [Halobacteria archaeon AArc-m2/3/4]|uniref:Dihydrodipicolinate synthase family protein n=1 Tax=Natronoglomus mannanivorans TaxID=2979990 RepID=A0AAP3E2K5_9EURY|nr:dihydrodipicolinate synthase family protein [Halobacteria archaeon AArc-xg1-1]MCU4973472.1 dihydrodipicolinate synthase family protein [Halobacteria archaeon AArc-m2/3/4]
MPLSTEAVQDHLRGVAVGLLTPFDADLEIEHSKLEDNARTLYGEGIRTFLATANISEYHSLSQEERIAVAETSVDALPEDACVLAGVGGSTADATELVRNYERIGADAMMIMPPDHTYLHERGLLEYYRELAAVTDRPLVPYVRGFDPSVEYLGDLTRIDGVVGIKYALADAVKLGAGIAAGDDDVVWVDGLAEPFALSFWAEGAEGFSAGVSNFRPEIGLALFDALSAGDWERARALRNACLPYQNFRDECGENNEIAGAVSVSAVKKGLELAGLYGGEVREPIRPLSADDERRAEELYGQLDDDIASLVDGERESGSHEPS